MDGLAQPAVALERLGTGRPRRLDVEVRSELDWSDVDQVIAFAAGWLLDHAAGSWSLQDVARFHLPGEPVRWSLGYLAISAVADG